MIKHGERSCKGTVEAGMVMRKKDDQPGIAQSRQTGLVTRMRGQKNGGSSRHQAVGGSEQGGWRGIKSREAHKRFSRSGL